MKKRNVLIFFMIIGLLTVFVTINDRIKVEGKNKSVEIALDYNETKALARQSDQDFSWWLKKFKGLGAVSVALEEESLQSMVKDDKDLELHMLGNLQNDIDWENKYDSEFVSYIKKNKSDKYDLIAITKTNEIYGFIINGLSERYPEKFFKGIKGVENYYIILDGSEYEALYTQAQKIINYEGKSIGEEMKLYSSNVAKIGLGFDPVKIKLIQDSGLKVLPRPINYNRFPEKLVAAFENELDKYNIAPSVLIFAGKEVLGYEGAMNELTEFMKENNMTVGMVETSVQREHLEQEGLEDVVEALDYNSIRVFSVWPYIQERFKFYNYEGAEEIENTFYRAVTERNIRLIYFKPFKEEQFKYVTDYVEYEKTFASFKERIERHGMTLGDASTMGSNSTGILRLILIGFGVAAAGLLFLNAIIDIKEIYMYILLGLGLLFIVAINLFWPSMADKLIALGASIIFPVLSITYLISYCKKIIKESPKNANLITIIKGSIVTLLICGGISLVGGLFVGAALSDIRYLLEMDIFRGVKISQLMPIVLFAVIYILMFGYGRDKEELANPRLDERTKGDFIRLLEQDVRVKHVLVSSILLIAGYIYIARTGHETAIEPSDIEMIIRNFMEYVLLARPRSKELFIAFPALMLTVYMAFRGYRKLVFPLTLASVIGLASVANTFSHLRTPVYLSAIRTFYSISFGALLGLVAIILFRGLEMIAYSFERRKN